MTFTENIKLSTFLAIKVQLEDVITVQQGKTIKYFLENLIKNEPERIKKYLFGIGNIYENKELLDEQD